MAERDDKNYNLRYIAIMIFLGFLLFNLSFSVFFYFVLWKGFIVFNPISILISVFTSTIIVMIFMWRSEFDDYFKTSQKVIRFRLKHQKILFMGQVFCLGYIFSITIVGLVYLILENVPMWFFLPSLFSIVYFVAYLVPIYWVKWNGYPTNGLFKRYIQLVVPKDYAEDFFCLETYRFSLPIDYKNHLKSGPVNTKLKQTFDDNKISLSNNARVSIINDKNWRIIDGTRRFRIEDTETTLSIYIRSFADQ